MTYWRAGLRYAAAYSFDGVILSVAGATWHLFKPCCTGCRYIRMCRGSMPILLAACVPHRHIGGGRSRLQRRARPVLSHRNESLGVLHPMRGLEPHLDDASHVCAPAGTDAAGSWCLGATGTGGAFGWTPHSRACSAQHGRGYVVRGYLARAATLQPDCNVFIHPRSCSASISCKLSGGPATTPLAVLGWQEAEVGVL